LKTAADRNQSRRCGLHPDGNHQADRDRRGQRAMIYFIQAVR